MSYSDALSVVSRAHASSTGTADVKTLAAPAGARAFLISVSAATLLTMDGTTPAANVGLALAAGFYPRPIPVGRDLQVAGNAVASEVEVVWLR